MDVSCQGALIIRATLEPIAKLGQKTRRLKNVVQDIKKTEMGLLGWTCGGIGSREMGQTDDRVDTVRLRNDQRSRTKSMIALGIKEIADPTTPFQMY